MVYISIGSELDTRPLIALLRTRPDITLCAPFTQNGRIIPRLLLDANGVADRSGNLPPENYGGKITPSTVIDTCVTPLLGINHSGYRIGYGKGCYDRFFCEYTVNNKIGFCFEEQFVQFEPQAHDVPLDRCVTEKKVIYF